MALGSRLERRCICTESVTCRTVMTKVTKRKPGRSIQKAGPNPRSSPDVAIAGMPSQRAFATRSKSRIPKSAAVRQPAPMARTGVQARTIRLPRSIRPTTARSVTAVTVGAAAAWASSGTRVSMAYPIGITVTATSAMSVPDTTGVMIRLRSASRAARANWQRAETTTSVPRSAGPPAASARTATPTEAPDAPITVSVPAPIPPMRTAWTIVMRPPMTIAAKMAHER